MEITETLNPKAPDKAPSDILIIRHLVMSKFELPLQLPLSKLLYQRQKQMVLIL